MDDKETVIYIGGFELPDKNAAAQRVIANARIIRELGYTPVLIGINRELRCYNVENMTYNKFYGFDCWGLPYPIKTTDWLKHLYDINGFIKILNKYKNIKAVICYNYQSIAFERIRVYCQKHKIKIIADCTEWYRSDEGSLPFRIIKYFDTSFRMRYVNKKVNALIVASAFLKNYYDMKSSVIIPTLISNFSNKANHEHLSGNEYPKLVYAGIPFRLGRQLKQRSKAKDRLDIAIQALNSIYKRGVKFTFDIYGITKAQYLQSLPEDKKIIDELEESLKFHGRKDSEFIKKEISNADYTLLIRDDNRTTKAGFPTKFTESIVCGTPVITNKTSDIDKFLIEGSNGFIIDKNNNKVDENKLIEILSLDKSTRANLKRYCRESNMFDISNWISEMKKVIES